VAELLQALSQISVLDNRCRRTAFSKCESCGVHIGDTSSNQATTLESEVIHMNQELFGQTLRKSTGREIARVAGGVLVASGGWLLAAALI